jgi:hypothetical protein
MRLVRTLRGEAYDAVRQGTAVVVREDGGYTIRYPNGDEQWCRVLWKVEAEIKRWARRQLRAHPHAYGILEVDWQ